MEMELKEALAIVLELAEQNALDVADYGDNEDLHAEAVRQEAAIEAVRIHYEAQS